ncbi:MAG: winged helix-turn-helix transcriptional regulator [Candidatus Thorarchaeota archaeon]
MDPIDKGILRDLTTNCRITYEELARKHGISANAIRKRVLRLEETEVIAGYNILLSTAMIGSEFVFGLLTTDGSQDEEEFVNKIGSHQGIIAASSYTDGIYALIGEYTDTTELMEISTYIRTLDSVIDIEIHTILQRKGGKADLNKLHLRVLNCLVEDPRMAIVDIAANTGLTARRVRRVLQEIEETQSVSPSILLELGAANSIPFIAWFTYDANKMGPKEFEVWLRENYDFPLWQVFVSVSEPVVGALFAVDNLTELDTIVREIRRNDFVETVKVGVSTHHQYFPGPRNKKIQEMLSTLET